MIIYIGDYISFLFKIRSIKGESEMFKFFREMKESIQEGVDEAKAEIAAENEERAHLIDDILSREMPSFENIVLALSCPFRKVLTVGDDLRLFTFGQMTKKEMDDFKKIMFRDFNVLDEESMKSALKEMDRMLCIDGVSNDVFRLAIQLYIITSSADAGFINLKDYEDECKQNMKEIVLNQDLHSWEDFAEKFMEGECINKAFGRKIIHSNIKKLLTEEDSPWVIFPWNKIAWEVKKLSV